MEKTKEFLSKYLTSLLALMIVVNLGIIIIGLMGIGWDRMDRVSRLFAGMMGNSGRVFQTHNVIATQNLARTTSGVVSGENVRLVCSDETFASAVSKVRPAVVNISCESVKDAPGGAGGPRFDNPADTLLEVGGIGSGVIIDERGYIVTCYHLVAQASNIVVTPFGYEEVPFRAKIVSKDESVNLALLKVNASYELPRATFGDSAELEPADVVLAVGSPFGMEQSVTHGIISDEHRDLEIGGRLYRGLIQTDVPVNPGSGGGPLVNINGEVVGINMAIYSPTGYYSGTSFAIPINKAKPLVARTLE